MHLEIIEIKETLRFNTLETTPKRIPKEGQNLEKLESSLYSN